MNKRRMFYIFAVVVSLLIFSNAYAGTQIKISKKISYENCIGKRISSVKKRYKKAGFSNISVVKCRTADKKSDGKFFNVTINGSDEFTIGDKFDSKAKVVLKYWKYGKSSTAHKVIDTVVDSVKDKVTEQLEEDYGGVENQIQSSGTDEASNVWDSLASEDGDYYAEETDNSAETETNNSTYINCEAGQLLDELEENASAAQLKYENQSISITGKVDEVGTDSIFLAPLEEDPFSFSFATVTCYFTDDGQKQIASMLSKGQVITIEGKCDRVGDILGYYIDVDNILY